MDTHRYAGKENRWLFHQTIRNSNGERPCEQQRIIYAEVPKATDTVKQKRVMLTGHCYMHPEEATSNLVLLTPNHGKRGQGRPAGIFVQQLQDDTGLKEREMTSSLMLSKDQWQIQTGRG